MNGLEALVIGTVVVGSTMSPQPKYDESATCLAKNMYYEARNQGTAGWMAVTAVVLNRVNDDRFPNTICEVVEEGPTRKSWKDPKVKIPVKHRCQFSWFCEQVYSRVKNKYQWEESVLVAKKALTSEVAHDTLHKEKAMYYHANYVKPNWNLPKITQIGAHIFYKERNRI